MGVSVPCTAGVSVVGSAVCTGAAAVSVVVPAGTSCGAAVQAVSASASRQAVSLAVCFIVVIPLCLLYPQHSAGLFPVGYSFVTGGLHLFLFQHIPDLPHAAQTVAKVQLAAQAGNVGVKRAGVTARAVIAPNGFVQIIPVQRPAAVAQKQEK